GARSKPPLPEGSQCRLIQYFATGAQCHDGVGDVTGGWIDSYDGKSCAGLQFRASFIWICGPWCINNEVLYVRKFSCLSKREKHPYRKRYNEQPDQFSAAHTDIQFHKK